MTDDPARPPRFPYVGALLCAACLGAALWTWIEYSYAWHLTPEQLWQYLPPSSIFTSPGKEPVFNLSGDYRYDGALVEVGGDVSRDLHVQARGRSSSPTAGPLSSDGPPRVLVVTGRGAASSPGRTAVYVGRVRPQIVAYPGGYNVLPIVDATASRFTGASVAGLVVGAMDETKGRPPRVIEIANTTTRIGPDRTPVRTIVAREYHGRNKKECYHVLYTNVAREYAYSLVKEFRLRQRHEQAYRVGVHDLNLDALTHGYEKDSKPEAPTFDEARVGLVAWIKALAFNALNEFKSHLPEPFSRMTAGSLMRHFILRPGKLYATADEFIVEIAPHPARAALEGYVEKLNAERVRIPWLGNRRLRIVLADEEVKNPGTRLACVLSPNYIWC